MPTVLGGRAARADEGADIVEHPHCVAAGGSAIPVPVGRAYEERFSVPVIEVYGMTETSSVHTIAYRDRPVRLGSVGHALPYSRMRVVELDGEGRFLRDCAADEIGVVAMAGPGVFSGYLSEVHNRSAFVEPGWVNSGDLGRLDDDGYLWITGRAKDLIIRGGHNIDPMAIEEVFFQHPAVALAAVVGEPDAYAGELPVAFVQLKPGVDGRRGRAARLRARAHARARRGAGAALFRRRDSADRGRQGLQAGPAAGRGRRAVSRLLADLAPDGASRSRSRPARMPSTAT